MKKYVVIKKRLRNFLYSLGFNYEVKDDITGRQKKIFLFEDNERLRECISFYSKIHKENKRLELNK